MKESKKIEDKIKKGVYFLDNNEEVKIVTKTMPHKQIFISNIKGNIIIEDYFEHKKRTSLQKCD